ncbi:UNVERIFIED_CONTAM: DExH-box ATP-dependent RNA helicase DExH3 [Sesamum latifolium]|uniref:RNA helicase n=1 Tax=Sesamum latifolium TaxID=2727402 RepID=A0AAW2XM51_9LAMI
MHSRLRVFLARAARKSSGLTSPSYSSNPRVLSNGDYTSFANVAVSSRLLQSQKLTYYSVVVRRGFSGYAVEQFSDDEYECDYENHPASSSVANIDEWKWKLSMLVRSDKDQEIVSKDKRDRRDFEQISSLAKRMGLYCGIYGKVVVASKVPLPNYRPDLDDKRPQREVVIPLSLQRRVEGLLQEHLDRTIVNSDEVGDTLDKMKNVNHVENVETAEHTDSFLDGSVMEKVLQRRGLRMRNMQRAWQVGFKVRLEGMKSKNTHLLFCTSGILLRRLLSDRNLDGITHVFVDEIHERGMNEGSSSARRDLRLILMSATLNADLFSSYFGEAPMIHIPKLIFEKPPPNVRKIILATNMAEASITINDIVFVVDCGKAKETTYDALNNTPCLLPSWISQASARQRRGRAGRVQPGECYHLYPRCVFEAFAEYQLPELLRTPLNSLCLQIKSLEVESIGDFLSAALQPPNRWLDGEWVNCYPLVSLVFQKPTLAIVPNLSTLQLGTLGIQILILVQNAVDFLKMIGALDENENLTHLGKFLTVLPVDPKGKMLIMGAIMRCFDPILTIVAGLSVRDPFLLPQDKKDLAGTAKSRFSAKDYSDHMALVRAYEGWKDADREGSAYEYCWRNFLSVQTLQAIHSLRKQFTYILKDAGLLDTDGATNNRLSHNQSLVRAVISSGLFPGIASVVHRETSMSFKTMDDGQVLLYANSVNARYQTIQYPWLVFGEKVKVNTVFIRDSTGVSDSILILFGGKLYHGATAGNLKMLDGYIDFFMDPSLAECYVRLKEELDKLTQKEMNVRLAVSVPVHDTT